MYFLTSTRTCGNTQEGSTSALQSKDTWKILYILDRYGGITNLLTTSPILSTTSKYQIHLGANFLFFPNQMIFF
jgi:hypothetical protein